MAGEGSWRTQPLPDNWDQIRAGRLALDGYRCTFPQCPMPADEVDHIGEAGDHRIEMLRSLCHGHHKAKSSGQGGAAWGEIRRRMAAARFRPQERHPGLRQGPERRSSRTQPRPRACR